MTNIGFLHSLMAPHLTLITHRTVLHGKAVRRVHRAEELKLILSLRHQRKLPKNLTIQFRNTEYQLTGYGKGFSLRGATITIYQGFNGSVTEATQRQGLTYRTLQQGEPAVTIADDKTVLNQVDQALHRQQKSTWKSVPDHPWRRPLTVFKQQPHNEYKKGDIWLWVDNKTDKSTTSG